MKSGPLSPCRRCQLLHPLLILVLCLVELGWEQVVGEESARAAGGADLLRLIQTNIYVTCQNPRSAETARERKRGYELWPLLLREKGITVRKKNTDLPRPTGKLSTPQHLRSFSSSPSTTSKSLSHCKFTDTTLLTNQCYGEYCSKDVQIARCWINDT